MDIRLNTTVQEIREETDGVTVTWTGVRLAAHFAATTTDACSSFLRRR